MKLSTVALKGLAVAFVCLAAMVLFASTASAQAQEPITQTLTTGDETGGVDLVFLIDNSVSMYKALDLEGNPTGPGNDVEKLRIESVRFVMTLLGFDNLFLHSNGQNRIGVITFGGPETASSDISLESLKTGSEFEWAGRYEFLAGKISENSKGATHPLEAFRLAAEMFEQADPAPEPRAKGIVLLTDGQPNLGPNQCCGDDFWGPYFEKLKAYIERAFPIAEEPRSTEGYHIWVVAMNEDWEEVKHYWVDIVGDRWRLIESANDIPTQFTTITEEIYSLCVYTDSEKCWLSESFAMPPYLDRAVFSIFASGPLSGDDPVVFYQEDGIRLSETDYVITSTQEFGKSIRRFAVSKPQPGMWKYETRQDLQVKVRFDPLFGNVQLVEPSGIQSQLSSIRVRFQLLDQRAEPIQEQLGFPLALSGQLWAPGSSEPMPLDFEYQDGLYSSIQEVPLAQTGDYRIRVKGTAIDSMNEQVTVVPTSERTFSVGASSARLVSPESGRAQQPLGPVEIVYQLLDATRTPVDIDPSLEVIARLHVESPSGATQTLDMLPIGDGKFSAPLFLLELGPKPYTLDVEGWLEMPEGRIELFQVEGDKLDVGMLRVNKIEPDGGKEHTQITLRFGIVDDYGDGLDPAFTSALDFSGSYAISPSGRQISPLGVQSLSANPGEATATLYADEWGDWQIHFEAFAKDAEGNPSNMVVGDWILPVIDSVPLKLVILEPGAGEKIPLRSVPRVWPFISGKPNPVEIKLQFLNGDNNSPVPFQDITNAPPGEVLNFTLDEPSGTNQGQQVQVAVSDADPSQLIASAAGLAEDGIHRFVAEIKADQSPKGGYVWPVSSSRPEVAFERVDKTRPWGLILTILEALLFILLLALIIYLIWLFSQPLRGVLYLRPGGVSREIDVPIASRRRLLTKRITGLEAFDIYKVRVRSMSKDPVMVHITIWGEEKESRWDFELEQHYGFEQVGKHGAVQVSYRDS